MVAEKAESIESLSVEIDDMMGVLHDQGKLIEDMKGEWDNNNGGSLTLAENKEILIDSVGRMQPEAYPQSMESGPSPVPSDVDPDKCAW